MVVCVENIQSKVGFVAILLRSGVIHWPTHPYIIPCFTGQSIKDSSILCYQNSPLGTITTEIGLPSACQSNRPHRLRQLMGWFFLIDQWSYLSAPWMWQWQETNSLVENSQSLMELLVIHLKRYLAHVFTKYLCETVAALKLRKELFAAISQWAEKRGRCMYKLFGIFICPLSFWGAFFTDLLRNH